MKDWKKTIINVDSNLKDALECLNQNALQIILIVDGQKKFVGVATDGDIRQAILNGEGLSTSITQIMNANPTIVDQNANHQMIAKTMREKGIRHIPIVDQQGVLVGLHLLEDFLPRERQFDNPVVLMVGGLGSRLKDLTKDCPKPMLKVGERPLLESIIENFKQQGFYQFFLCVNYKEEVFREYFQDGSAMGINIEYIVEPKKMGTAGALSLLKDKLDKSFIVMNGDVLTKIEFGDLIDFHESKKAFGTICVRQYEHQIPYGVIRTQNDDLIALEEKPVERYFVNAGVYALDPKALELIPEHEYFDMTELFSVLLQEKKNSAVYPINDYWLDIGRLDDFKKANLDFSKVFKKP